MERIFGDQIGFVKYILPKNKALSLRQGLSSDLRDQVQVLASARSQDVHQLAARDISIGIAEVGHYALK